MYDDLRDLNLAPPPRSVPLLLRGQLLFGGLVSQFGWAFFGFGTIFVWLFGLRTDPAALVDFSGELDTAKGVVTGRRETGASEGGTEHTPGNPIYAIHYRFRTAGRRYTGASYSTTKRAEGGGVTIEFPKGRPERSRIEGMRTAVFPAWALFTVLFPLFGAGLFSIGLWKGWKAIRLLKWGKPALGTLKSKESTGFHINHQTVYKLTFEFTDDIGNVQQAVAKTHKTYLLKDDAQELLFYDPARPNNATLVDHLRGSPRIDETGSVRTSRPRIALLAPLVPAASVIGHGTYAYLRFFS